MVETKQQRINLRRRRLAIHLNLALTYLWKSALAKAALQCDVVLEMDPRNQKALLRKGDAALRLGDIRLARITYNKLKEINPQHPDLESRYNRIDEKVLLYRLECLLGKVRFFPQLIWVSFVILNDLRCNPSAWHLCRRYDAYLN